MTEAPGDSVTGRNIPIPQSKPAGRSITLLGDKLAWLWEAHLGTIGCNEDEGELSLRISTLDGDV